MSPSPRQVDDELVNVGLFVVLGGAVFLGLLRLAGSIAAAITGAVKPDHGLGGTLGVLTDPADPGAALGSPGLSAFAYWLVVAALVTLVAAISWSAWRVLGRLRETSRPDIRRIDGVATRRDITRVASDSALLKRAHNLRPSLPKPGAADVGYLLGHARGHGIWSSVEDSTLVLGPPRSGKGLHLVVNAILDAPGPSSPPPPGPTTSPSRSRPGASAGRSPSSIPSTSQKVSPAGCAGRPYVAARTHSAR